MAFTAQWEGYLLKAVLTDEIFPLKYIVFDTWEGTFNQREELKAYREENLRHLHRITAEGEKSTFKFNIRDSLHLKDIEYIKNWFYDAEVDHKERKIEVIVWDADLLRYRPLTCYNPNPTFKIKRIEDNDVIFDERTIEFIEY